MPRSLCVELDRDVRAPARARRALRELAPAVHEDVLADVRLLVSELITNSVKYGEGGPVRLEVEAHGERLRAEIIDQGTGFTPVQRDRELTDVGGWGLHLVEELTDDWGAFEGSTHVWFEIRRRPRPA